MNAPFSLKSSNADGQPEKAAEKLKPAYVEIDNLENLDLGSELLSSYNRASRLFVTIEHDDDIPPNQKAQVLNTIRGIQEQILRNQERAYNVNKLKVIENTLIDVLKGFPEVKEAFIREYEKAARALEKTEKESANA